MKENQTQIKKAVALLCIILILISATVVFFSHSHGCIETDCAICETIESLRNAFLYLCTFDSRYILWLALLAWCAHTLIFSVRESTPVGRKVKLSD